MKKIVHISDLHFGVNSSAMMHDLLSMIRELRPDIIIVSGDLTQRALNREFLGAKKFLIQLEDITQNVVVIPGNHDIYPVYRPMLRAMRPFERYRKYIASVLEPRYVDDEVAIAGVNTVSRATVMNGKIHGKGIESAAKWFRANSDDLFKIVVTHHPLDVAFEANGKKAVKSSEKAIEPLTHAGVDLYLAGHHHYSSASIMSEHDGVRPRAAVIVQAGTVSRRNYLFSRSFNVITLNENQVEVDIFEWNEEDKMFVPGNRAHFARKNGQFREVHA